MAERKKARQNSLLQAVRRTGYDGNFAEALAANFEPAWEAWVKHCANYERHCLHRLYDVYGYAEMRCKNIQQEMVQSMNLAAVEAARKFSYDNSISDEKNLKRFYAYAHNLIANAAKRFIEAENGVTSKHYSWFLLHMKNKGLDLWSSPDEFLFQSILECYPKCKNLPRQLAKIREYFRSIISKCSCEEHKTEISAIRYDIIESVEFRVVLEQFQKEIGEFKFGIFWD